MTSWPRQWHPTIPLRQRFRICRSLSSPIKRCPFKEMSCSIRLRVMLNQLSDNPLLLWASLLTLAWFTFKKEPSHKMKGKHYPRTPPPSPQPWVAYAFGKFPCDRPLTCQVFSKKGWFRPNFELMYGNYVWETGVPDKFTLIPFKNFSTPR